MHQHSLYHDWLFVSTNLYIVMSFLRPDRLLKTGHKNVFQVGVSEAPPCMVAVQDVNSGGAGPPGLSVPGGAMEPPGRPP